MAAFGLDQKFVTEFKANLDVSWVRQDQANDFFILPQIDSIYVNCPDKLRDYVANLLKTSKYSPKTPIEMEVPKTARVHSRALSMVGPNYSRPGAVLWPDDRIVYHFLAMKCSDICESSIDRSRVFSNAPAKPTGSGFVPASLQWTKLKKSLQTAIATKKYQVVLKCDISQYFNTINQHELVNSLEHDKVPLEICRFIEKFLGDLTLDRSSRGLVQGGYGSDFFGNIYLAPVDEAVKTAGVKHFRYVDDMYLIFEELDQFRQMFPKFIKVLRSYDLSLNESKTSINAPLSLVRDETELDRAISRARKEAMLKLSSYEEVEVDSGPYGGGVIEVLETVPDEEEVELESTKEIFRNLDDFQGEEAGRAELFCLGIFRRSGSTIAFNHVISKWTKHPEKAKDYALYINRFIDRDKYAEEFDKLFVGSASDMTDWQWTWAATLARRLRKVSPKLMQLAISTQKDPSRHDVVRSLLTYVVCRHGSAQLKKEMRDSYTGSPFLVQLALIHASRYFTSAERNAMLKTIQGSGGLADLMCDAVKLELAAEKQAP